MGKMFRGKFMATLKTYYEKKLLFFGGRCQDLRDHYNWKELPNTKGYSCSWWY